MSKFCGKCGRKLDEKTGLCPNCDANKLLEKKRNGAVGETSQRANTPDYRKPVKLTRKQKKAIKKAKRTKSQKVRSVLIKMIAVLLAALVLFSGCSILLAYNHLIDIPIISNLFNKNNNSTTDNSSYFHYDGDFSNKKIENANKAPEVLK